MEFSCDTWEYEQQKASVQEAFLCLRKALILVEQISELHKIHPTGGEMQFTSTWLQN